MHILKGKIVVDCIKKNIIESIEKNNIKPKVVAVIVGDNPEALCYLKAKQKKASKFGIELDMLNLPGDISENDLISKIENLNNDSSVDGVIIERPIPDGLNFINVISALDPKKDVDCATSTNLGLIMQGVPRWFPATADAVVRILNHYEIPVEGQHVVVLGRSLSVGLPLANMLLLKKEGKNATVTVCHSRTKNLKEICQSADILVAAIGRAEFVDESYIKPSAVIIDVGINYNESGLTGDVNFGSIEEKAYAATPVPGGVGPVTVSILFENCVKAAIDK